MQVKETSTGDFIEAARIWRRIFAPPETRWTGSGGCRRTWPGCSISPERSGSSCPASMGGPQVDPITAYHVVEELSRSEASVGWCALLSNGGAVFTGNFAPEVGRAMFGFPPDFRTAGSFRALGEARPAPGGYRVSGRWDYASGIDNANWLFVNCKVVDD